MVPVVVSISYVNYAIVAVLGGLLALHGKADIGSLASYLVFVRQAALPINQFTQQSNFLLSALAGAERVFDVMSLEPEIDEGKVELVDVERRRERRTCRLRRDNRPLGMEAPGRNDDGIKGRCAF